MSICGDPHSQNPQRMGCSIFSSCVCMCGRYRWIKWCFIHSSHVGRTVRVRCTVAGPWGLADKHSYSVR